MFGASASNGRLGPADAGPRHDLGLTQIRSATADAAGSRPPPLEADCSDGGIRLEFFLAVIIQGGIMPQIQPLFPSVIDFLQ